MEYMRRNGYDVKHYATVLGAIRDLVDDRVSPLGYFVDMKLEDDLGGSERFCNFIKCGSYKKPFFFITGSISEHDKEVHKRTQTEVYSKLFVMRNFDYFKHKIEQNQ